MGYMKYVRRLWKQPKDNLSGLYQERIMQWRREPASVTVDHPTRPDRARSLGYKAKQGVIVVRQRLIKGSHVRPMLKAGRRPRRTTQRMSLDQSYQVIAEQRAAKKHKNCEVLNSYWAAEDGRYCWYEVILVDRDHPSVRKDKQLQQIAKQRARASRGITSAGRKSRGLSKKGIGTEKTRPSRTAERRRKVRTQKRKE